MRPIRLRLRPFAAGLLVLATLSLPLALPGSAGAAGTAVYTGSFDPGSLTWERGADGRLTPSLPDTRSLDDAGQPDLPGRALTLLVPVAANIGELTVVPLSTRIVEAPGPLATASPQVSSEGVSVGQLLDAGTATVYPTTWGTYGGTQFLRGFRLATVVVHPLRAMRGPDEDGRHLEFLESYEIRMQPLPGPVALPDVAQRQRRVPGERARLDALLQRVVANPDAIAGYAREDGAEVVPQEKGLSPDKTPSLSGSAVSYLIITSDALAAAFQPLADLRTSQGLPAVVKTVEWIEANYRNGVDLQETVRMFIRDAYEKWGVEYVLLGGDTDIVPARYITSDFYPPGGETIIPADLYFSCLDGNWNADGDMIFGEATKSTSNPGDNCDMANDVAFGRAPVSTVADVNAFVTKVINYESAGSDADFANRFLAAAEVLFRTADGSTITLDGADYAQAIYDSLLVPCTGMSDVRMFQSWNLTDEYGQPLYPGSMPESASAALDSLETGHFNIFDQIGHGYFFNMEMGAGNIITGDADALHNGADHPFLLYALNCASGAFDYSCLLERFVKNPDGGSFASIGASRAAFPSTANDFQYEFFNQLFCQGVPRLGDLMGLSRLPWLAYSDANSFTRWTYMNYTLLGDPAQSVWTATPSEMQIAAPSNLVVGPQDVAVTVTSGGQPVVGARVVLQMGDDVYAWGVTNGSGSATIASTPLRAGTMKMTVSAIDRVMTTRNIAVANPGAYIALDQVTVVDDGTGGTAGNGDGTAAAGETVGLTVRFADTGSGGAAGLTADLSTTTPGVTIIDGSTPVADIASGGTGLTTAPFLVSFDAGVADGTHVTWDLHVHNAGDAWDSSWEQVVVAPELEPLKLEWYDAPYGNNDGIVDSGERITVLLRLKNYGAGIADGLTGRLRTNSANVVIQDSLVSYPDIPLMGESSGTGLYSLHLVNATLPYDARIEVSDAWGHTTVHPFQMTTPTAPIGVNSLTALGPDVIELTWSPVSDPGVRGYNVYRSDSETGPFSLVNPDVLGRISYFRDTGLNLLTRYYYRVATVDSSLVESPQSLTFAKSTAPPELGNFPLPIAKETSSHCAVGDVTGDGRFEIVLAADELYVWREDGTELFDGDGNSQTLGPITNLGGRLTPMGVALANLDGDRALEIICADRDLKLMYAFNADGTLVPGWPQPTGRQWVWAPPAVGDIDGDGEVEIVANNLSSQTLAWHKDGTEVRDGDNNAATNGVLIDRYAVINRDEWCRSAPALFDLDGDGAKDIIFGTRYGFAAQNYLHAYRWDGTETPGFPIPTGAGGSIMCSPTVADLDDDGVAEIIYTSEDDSLRVVHQDGTNYPGFPRFMREQNMNSDITCPSPAVGDFDLDGDLEIVAVENFDPLDSDVHVIETSAGVSGQDMPGWPRSVPGNSESSPVVGDLDGDGHPDVVFGIGGGDTESPNNIYAFSYDGQDLDGFPLTLGGPIRPAPVICDLNQDGTVDLVYGGWDFEIHVWDLPAAYDPTQMPWPTFRGYTLRDGVFRRVSSTDVPDGVPTPKTLTLMSNVPNPFNPSTTVRLYVPADAADRPLAADVYDVQGRRVRSLHRGPAAAGWLTLTWQGNDDAGRRQASGAYFLRVVQGGEARTLKMMLVK